jgi:hypothetical protein
VLKISAAYFTNIYSSVLEVVFIERWIYGKHSVDNRRYFFENDQETDRNLFKRPPICDFFFLHETAAHPWVERHTLLRSVDRLLAHDTKVIEQFIPDSDRKILNTEV